MFTRDENGKMVEIEEKENESVVHPEHYGCRSIEPIDFMWDNFTKEEFVGFCLGNVCKYIGRWRKKDGIIDLYKAMQYLEKAIDKETEEE